MLNSSEEVTFEDLEATDVISVDIVPERKGLILKHCEYFVSSRRHGTTVTRRYNDFATLCDVFCAKYPYRAVCRLPPKRVVVGGGSPLFLQRRRAALQRWLTLVARHPVLAHDADLRTFLCETTSRLEKPRHDEFVLAGTQDENAGPFSIDEMQAEFVSEHEQLRLVQLGLSRLYKILERVGSRSAAGLADVRELGAALGALGSRPAPDPPRWNTVRAAVQRAAQLAVTMGESAIEEVDYEDGAGAKVLLALDVLGAYRDLCGRLTRGLHGERAAAAAGDGAPLTAAAGLLRRRHRYALACALEESRVARAYALAALQSLHEVLHTHSVAHAHTANVWVELHEALRST
ncbi:unnamed protein product, partial [Iphiclides podalirius]